MADQNIKIKIDLDVAEFNKHARELSTTISNILGRDIQLANANLNQTAQAARRAGDAMNTASRSATNAATTVKKANMQWTNFALVIQDLPYGFRGIQNNLPALMGGFAALSGPLYLVGSAVIALFTAWDAGIIKFGNSIKISTNYSKEAATTFASETIQLESLYRVSQNVTVSMSDRISAAEILIKQYPTLLGMYSAEDIALGKAAESYDKLKSAVWAYAKVKAAEGVLIELGAKQNELTIKRNKILADQRQRDLKGLSDVNYMLYNNLSISEQFIKTFNDLPKNGPFGPIVQSFGAMAKSSQLLYDVNQEQENLNIKAKEYQDIIDDNILLSNLFKESKKEEKGGKGKFEQDTSLLERLKKEQKLYKDDIDEFYRYGALIIKEEERLAIERANYEKKSAEEIKNIRAGFQADMIANQQEYGRAIMAIADKNTKAYEEEERKLAEIILENRRDMAEALSKINADINKDNIKNVNDELGVTLKAVGRNYRAQKEAYDMAIQKLQEKKKALEEAGIATTGYDDAISNLQTRMEGLVDPLETLNQTIQGIFDNLQIDLLVAFGETLGEALAGGQIDTTKLGTILADALQSIGKALITYGIMAKAAIEALKNPLGWAIAIGAGVAAIAAGAALKSKLKDQKATKFANGGIVSGPTMGLVGEYPGAKSNPEVIAPLDKLKSIIGGNGGGTFVLRGQDLLLATNRAQKASNLKGQNISLA